MFIGFCFGEIYKELGNLWWWYFLFRVVGMRGKKEDMVVGGKLKFLVSVIEERLVININREVYIGFSKWNEIYY